jgi:hypothetical protein
MFLSFEFGFKRSDFEETSEFIYRLEETLRSSHQNVRVRELNSSIDVVDDNMHKTPQIYLTMYVCRNYD